MAFRALLSKQQPQGCNVPAGAPSVSGGPSNPLTSFLASATQDPLRTQQLMEGYDLSSLQGPLADPLGAPLGAPQEAAAQQRKGPQGPLSTIAVTEGALPPIEAAAAEAFTARAVPSWGVEGLLAGSSAAAAAAAAAEAAAEASLMRTSQFKGPLLPPATADATAAGQQQQQPAATPWAAEFVSMHQQQQHRQRSFEGDTGLVQTWAKVGRPQGLLLLLLLLLLALVRLSLLILLAAIASAVALRQEFSSLSLGEYGEMQQQQQQQQQAGAGLLAAPPPSMSGAFEASRQFAAAAAAPPLGFFPPSQQLPFPLFFNPMQSHQQQYQQRQQQHLQQRQQQQQQQEQQDEKLTEQEQQDEPAKPEAFDPLLLLLPCAVSVAAAAVTVSHACVLLSLPPLLLVLPLLLFAAKAVARDLVRGLKALLSADGERVEWDEVLAAREAMKLTEATEPEAGLLGSSSPEAGSDFEARLKELEEAWKKAHENGEIDAEELGLFQSIFKSDDMTRILQEQPRTMGDGFAALRLTVQCLGLRRYGFARTSLRQPAGLAEMRLPKEQVPPAKPVGATSASEPQAVASAATAGGGLSLAHRLLAEGKLQAAIEALKEEVQRSPHSSEGWRLLGECHAANEQASFTPWHVKFVSMRAHLSSDVEAIHCLKKGHGVDPYNLDSLMALGVSLTNELDVPQALLYLRERPPDDFAELKQHVLGLFEKALENPQSSEGRLHSALGVLYNIDRHYDKALFHLAQALRYASVNNKGEEAASLWNKVGATLANSGRSAAALVAYEQTLRLKPNYPRAWTNLGVAKANLGEMEEALQHYLVALELNPDASHLWYYIRSALISLSKP
ncbi:hypothetical protein Emag_004886 [Eimeria magna]